MTVMPTANVTLRSHLASRIKQLARFWSPASAICQMSSTDCQFHEFAESPYGPVHFLSPDQQSRIHCLIICGIQLLTPNGLGGT